MWRIKRFINSIYNLIYYFKVIWNDRDYDFAYIDDLLLVKLKKIYKRYSTTDYFVDQDINLIKPLRICIEILERDSSSFYWNTSNYDKRECSQYCNADNCELRNKDILWKIISKYCVYWWD